MQRLAPSTRQFSSWLGQNWTNSARGVSGVSGSTRQPTGPSGSSDPYLTKKDGPEGAPTPELEQKFAQEARENRGNQTDSPGAKGAEYPTEGKKLVEEAKQTFKEARENPDSVIDKAKDFVKRTTGWGQETRTQETRKPFT